MLDRWLKYSLLVIAITCTIDSNQIKSVLKKTVYVYNGIDKRDLGDCTGHHEWAIQKFIM